MQSATSILPVAAGQPTEAAGSLGVAAIPLACDDIDVSHSAPLSIVDILIEQAMREEKIIIKMKKAVMAGDKETVFQLARELTCKTNIQR